jgi:hypothetical protein
VGELALAHLRGGHERQAVPARAEHEVERGIRPEGVDQWRGVGPELRAAEALLEERQAAVERADLEGDRAGIDARDARPALPRRAQATSSLAIS